MKLRLYDASWIAVLWLISIICVVMISWQKGPRIDTDMMSLLPASEQQPLVQAAGQQSGSAFAQRLLILLSGDDQQAVSAAVEKVATRYELLDEVGSVSWQVDEAALTEASKELTDYRYVLLEDSFRDKLEAGDFDWLRDKALADITGPMSGGQQNLRTDPFGLMQAWQWSQRPQMQVRFEGGLMAVGPAERPYYLVIVNLAAQAFSLPVQQVIHGELDALTDELAEQGIEVLPSGLLVHAHAGAEQAKKETSTIGLGSLLAIIVVMLWVFRRFKVLGLLLLPVTVGGIMATSGVFIIFEEVHLVTFAFGAGLVGVSIDYALHFICERQQQYNALKRIIFGLILGLLSSVLAYSALAMTPFPGLRQMAVFSVIGLISAWLTVVLWFPRLMRHDALQQLPAMDYLPKLQQKLPNITQHRGLQFGLGLLLLAAVWVLWLGQADDDIRLLQTSPPELMQQEQRIQKLLGLQSGTQFLLFPCDQLQQCLEKEEMLKPALQAYQQKGVLSSFTLLSEQLPSLQRQQQNAQWIEQLYQSELSQLFEVLSLPESAQALAMQAMQEQISARLTVESLPQDSYLATAMQQRIVEESGQFGTIIGLAASPSVVLPDAIDGLLAAHPELIFVDNVAAISHLLKHYREQVMILVSLAYLFIFGILFWRYRSAALRVILPPLLASVFALALLTLLLPGINLFHVMALILVLGIGLDMGIFLNETRQAKATWLAVSLSVLTSLIAFGLLSLSQTPILRHFGLTVLLGLAFVWLLAMLIRPLTPQEHDSYEASK